MKKLPVLIAIGVLAGCVNPEIGVTPKLSPMAYNYPDPTLTKTSFPDAPAASVKRFSLWDDRQSRLFTDPRALRVGDILTVLISISDQAKLKNDTDRSRTGKKSLGLTGSWALGKVAGSSGSGNLSSDSESTFNGTGDINRSEDIKLSVAAIVTGVMANGNLIIRGSQEVRVNAEIRVLTIEGIVRPADIGANNTISYDRIAEARISYGGRGRLTEVQQPSWGQQAADLLLPF